MISQPWFHQFIQSMILMKHGLDLSIWKHPFGFVLHFQIWLKSRPKVEQEMCTQPCTGFLGCRDVLSLFASYDFCFIPIHV